MVSDYLRPYVFRRTMELWSDNDEHFPCCGACASIGATTSSEDRTDFFRYGAHETLAIRARTGARSEDFRGTKAVV